MAYQPPAHEVTASVDCASRGGEQTEPRAAIMAALGLSILTRSVEGRAAVRRALGLVVLRFRRAVATAIAAARAGTNRLRAVKGDAAGQFR